MVECLVNFPSNEGDFRKSIFSFFQHFLLLSVAMAILSQENNDLGLFYLPYANDLMKYFVYNSKRIYGKTFTVFNVHHLLHVGDDCVNYNCSLNDIPCFPYENFLQRLKTPVQNSWNTIAEMIKHHYEYQQCFGQLRK